MTLTAMELGGLFSLAGLIGGIPLYLVAFRGRKKRVVDPPDLELHEDSSPLVVKPTVGRPAPTSIRPQYQGRTGPQDLARRIMLAPLRPSGGHVIHSFNRESAAGRLGLTVAELSLGIECLMAAGLLEYKMEEWPGAEGEWLTFSDAGETALLDPAALDASLSALP